MSFPELRQDSSKGSIGVVTLVMSKSVILVKKVSEFENTPVMYTLEMWVSVCIRVFKIV